MPLWLCLDSDVPFLSDRTCTIDVHLYIDVDYERTKQLVPRIYICTRKGSRCICKCTPNHKRIFTRGIIVQSVAKPLADCQKGYMQVIRPKSNI